MAQCEVKTTTVSLVMVLLSGFRGTRTVAGRVVPRPQDATRLESGTNDIWASSQKAPVPLGVPSPVGPSWHWQRRQLWTDIGCQASLRDGRLPGEPARRPWSAGEWGCWRAGDAWAGTEQ